MKKLIEALQVIRDECAKYDGCHDCPMYVNHYGISRKCIFDYHTSEDMHIDEVKKALLGKEQT